MIHTYIYISGIADLIDRVLQDLQFGFRQGNILFRNHALTFETRGQMCVVINRKSVGPHVDDLFEGSIKTVNRLMWQAVDQVERDWCKVLNAKTQAVEPEACQYLY
jgi:hypothetical protein